MQERRLDFTPRPEDMPSTAEIMTKDLFRDGYTDDDCIRIRDAINLAGRNYPRFPTLFHVKQFIKSTTRIEYEKEESTKKIEMSDEAREKERQKRIANKNKAMKEINKILSKKTDLEKKISNEDNSRRKGVQNFIKRHLHDEDAKDG